MRSFLGRSCIGQRVDCSLQASSTWSRRRFLSALSAIGAGQLHYPSIGIASKIQNSIFSDVTADAGITWRHFNGFSPDRYLIEAMGGGVGLLDFDGDGWLERFLLNGGETPRGKSETPLQNALYRNLGNGKFVDVAAAAGLNQVTNYGMGVAVADFDNDGHQDIFVTGFPNCTLYRNNGNGTFTDVTADAGLQNSGKWASGAAGFDVTIAATPAFLCGGGAATRTPRCSARSVPPTPVEPDGGGPSAMTPRLSANASATWSSASCGRPTTATTARRQGSQPSWKKSVNSDCWLLTTL